MSFVSTNITVVLISEAMSFSNKGSKEILFYRLVALGLKSNSVSLAFIVFHGITIFLLKSF